jgi:hypothetical protein
MTATPVGQAGRLRSQLRLRFAWRGANPSTGFVSRLKTSPTNEIKFKKGNDGIATLK